MDYCIILAKNLSRSGILPLLSRLSPSERTQAYGGTDSRLLELRATQNYISRLNTIQAARDRPVMPALNAEAPRLYISTRLLKTSNKKMGTQAPLSPMENSQENNQTPKPPLRWLTKGSNRPAQAYKAVLIIVTAQAKFSKRST